MRQFVKKLITPVAFQEDLGYLTPLLRTTHAAVLKKITKRNPFAVLGLTVRTFSRHNRLLISAVLWANVRRDTIYLHAYGFNVYSDYCQFYNRGY